MLLYQDETKKKSPKGDFEYVRELHHVVVIVVVVKVVKVVK